MKLVVVLGASQLKTGSSEKLGFVPKNCDELVVVIVIIYIKQEEPIFFPVDVKLSGYSPVFFSRSLMGPTSDPCLDLSVSHPVLCDPGVCEDLRNLSLPYF